jgi:transcriptional regulator with XRE-family HTH domain
LTRVKRIQAVDIQGMRPSKNPELINALAVELKVRRLQLGLSQEDLAGRAELDRPYISLIEVGKKQPTLSVLLKLAIGLDLSLGVFMRRVQKRYERSGG